MLRDYHVDNNAWNFLALIVFFALKLSKFSKGDCDMLVSGPLLNTLYFYFRHFLSTYWLISH